MLYYKVVRKEHGKLLSAVTSSKYAIEYKPGEWTGNFFSWLLQLGYGPLVFNTLKRAKQFAECHSQYVIYACEVRGLKKNLPPYDATYGSRSPLMRRLRGYAGGWPDECSMVRRVKLVHKV